MAITLRPATLSDVPLLKYWDKKPHVIAVSGADGDGNFDWEYELSQDFDWYECLIAELDALAIGVVQVIDPAKEYTQYWGECGPNLRAIDIWIGEETEIGKGYGTAMMRLAHDRCFADNAVKAILLDPLVSNENAHRFYERLGYQQIDRCMFGDDDCYVYKLNREVWVHHPLSQ